MIRPFSLRTALLGSTFLVALSAASSFPSAPVYAACTINGNPNNLGTAGPDTAVCDAVNNPGAGVDLNTQAEDDTITFSGGTVQNILAGSENDAITFSGGTASTIRGDQGNDTITVTGGTVGQILGDDGDPVLGGDDKIFLTSGTLTGDASGGAGNDEITLGGTAVNGSLFGDAGDDKFFLNSSNIMGSVFGGDGVDTVNLNGSTIDGDIKGEAGDDIVNLNSGTVGGSVFGGDGIDHITLNGASITGDIKGDAGDDIIDLTSGDVSGSVFGGDGIDHITLNGASVTKDIKGDAGDDIINLNSGTVSESVFGGDGIDTITLNGASITGDIQGDAGDDIIDLTSGNVSGSVLGGTGLDHITLNGSSVLGDIYGDDGNDTIDLLSGGLATGSVYGDAGDDTINLGLFDPNTVTTSGNLSVGGFIYGGDDNDTINLISGTVQESVWGEDGNDTIDLGGVFFSTVAQTYVLYGGATVNNDVDGGDGDDNISLYAGTVTGAVTGGDGNDTIKLGSEHGSLGTASVGSIDAGAGNDRIELYAGTVTNNSVVGGTGSDTILIGPAFDTGASLVLDGGDGVAGLNGTDTLIVDGGVHTLVGANTLGFEGIILDNESVVKFSDAAVTVGASTLQVINGSTLLANNNLTVTGGVSTDSTGTIDAGNTTVGTPNTFTVTGNFSSHAGLLTMATGANETGDKTVVTGTYTGNGGTISSDVDLVAETADQFLVTGAISGNTTLGFNITQGGGTLLNSDILLVQGASGSTGTITSQTITDGLVDYNTVKIPGTNPTPDQWVLRSTFSPTGIANTVGSYANTVASVMTAFSALDLPQFSKPNGAVAGSCYLNPWVRGKFGQNTLDHSGSLNGVSASSSSDVDFYGFVGGMDCGFYGELDIHVGALGGEVWGDATSRQKQGSKLNFEAPFVGVYLNAASGPWALNVVYAHDFYTLHPKDSDVFAVNPTVDGNGNRVRGEVSYTFDFGSGITLLPSASLEYASVSIDSFDAIAARVNIGDTTNLIGRAGLRLSKDYVNDSMGMLFRPFAEARVVGDFDGDNNVTVTSGATSAVFKSNGMGTYGEFGLGTEMVGVTQGLSAFARVDAQVGQKIEGYSVEGGLRFSFDALTK